MPSFDIESKIDNHELSNAIDKLIELSLIDTTLKMQTPMWLCKRTKLKFLLMSPFIGSNYPNSKENLSKRKIDLKSLKIGETQEANNSAQLNIELVQGISSEIGKEINALIKSKKIKYRALFKETP